MPLATLAAVPDRAGLVQVKRTGRAARFATGKKAALVFLLALVVAGLIAGAAGCLAGLRPSGEPGRELPGSGQGGTGEIAWRPGQAAVHFLDVGQGDSILVRFPSGFTMLVDGGGREAGPGVVRYMRAHGITRIDALVVTHGHEDHVGGLPAVLGSFPVGRAYLNSGEHTTVAYESLLRALIRKKVPVTIARGGTLIRDEETAGAVVVGPVKEYEDENDGSLVLRVRVGRVAFLLTGDAGSRAEADMLAAGVEVDADVLKVGHHGSAGSTAATFLNAVGPRWAVISVGAENPFGHPAPSVLGRLSRAGVTVYRTDANGTVILFTDGQKVWIRVERGDA